MLNKSRDANFWSSVLRKWMGDMCLTTPYFGLFKTQQACFESVSIWGLALLLYPSALIRTKLCTVYSTGLNKYTRSNDKKQGPTIAF